MHIRTNATSFLGLGLFLLLLLPAGSNVSAASEIVTLSELRDLKPDPAGVGRPLRLNGVVVCYDAGWHQLYLNDGHQTEYFNADDFVVHPEKGQRVEITGVAHSIDVLENLKLTVQGQGTMPAAKRLGLSELDRDHGQWVEIEGQILSAETSRGRLALLLHENGQNCLIYVLGESPPGDFKKFLDCKVAVRGINASKMAEGRLESALLFAPGVDQIKILEPRIPREPVPVVSISSLLNHAPGSWTDQWVHINGLIIAYQPGQSLVVKDPTGTIRARIVQLTEITGDERVDVWGFLHVSRDDVSLRSAYFEVTQRPTANVVQSTSTASNSNPPDHPEVMTRMSEIRKLRREEAAQGIPVRVRGVLTYADSAWRNGFIQDRSEALYVDLEPAQKELKAGQWVELTGQTSPGGFAPEVIHSKLTVLGQTNLPPPARVNLEDLAYGDWDAHWVEMEGVVRGADEQSEHLNLSVMTSGGRFRVIIPKYGNTPPTEPLIYARISVQGACTSELNARGQLSGITLHTPSLDYVKILESPPADPFAIAATRVGSVATFDPGRLAGRRVKVQGVVTLTIPDGGFYLQDDSGGMRVLTGQPNEIHIGDRAEALGFPVIGNFSPFLEETSFRRLGAQALPSPIRTSAEQILLHGTNDAQYVEITARLQQSVPRSSHMQLVLQDGPIIFTANFDGQTGGLEAPALESGSLLRLSGICSIQGGERHEPVTFRLLLPQPENIAVLETPPWWTPGHTLMLASGLMLLVSVTLAWAGLLRRQVRMQTEVIRQQLKEAEALEREILEISNREQRRIGHDLHDGVCQQLAGIALLSSSLADELEICNAEGSAEAERISKLLNEVIEQTRGVARGLFPVRLEEKGLASALEEFAVNAAELYKINCRFAADTPPAQVDKAIALHLYYIVLEAVANASKHSSASDVVIRLKPHGDRYLLSVQDNGIGFSPSAAWHSGMGIRIMEYRARVIGATLDLQSQPGAGTLVTCLFTPVSGAAFPADKRAHQAVAAGQLTG